MSATPKSRKRKRRKVGSIPYSSEKIETTTSGVSIRKLGCSDCKWKVKPSVRSNYDMARMQGRRHAEEHGHTVAMVVERTTTWEG